MERFLIKKKVGGGLETPSLLIILRYGRNNNYYKPITSFRRSRQTGP